MKNQNYNANVQCYKCQAILRTFFDVFYVRTGNKYAFAVRGFCFKCFLEDKKSKLEKCDDKRQKERIVSRAKENFS